MQNKNLTIIIPYYNGEATIGKLIASIPDDIPTIIVDDQSMHVCAVKKANVTVIRPNKKRYFAGAVNVGIDACKTDVLVLNQDSSVSGNGWQELIDTYRGEYALIGERIKGAHPAWPYGYVQGTFMFMRRDAINKVGLLDEKHFPLWGGTADWQVRACRKNYRVMSVDPVPGFIHHRVKGEVFGSSIARLLKEHPEKRDLLIRTPPLVSVVVPCYNYGKYLPDLIASLIGGDSSLGELPGQTFGGFEVIIVNDASTDDTATIIARLIDPHKGIRSVTHQRRVGTPSANNSGIKASYGRAITILSADDAMESERLEKMYDEWERTPEQVIYDDLQLFGHGKRGEVWHMPEYDFDALIEKNQMHCGIMFSRKAWQDVGGFHPETIYGREDWAFNIRLGLGSYCGRHISYPGYMYRREGHNRTTRDAGGAWAKFFKQQMEYLFPSAYNREERPMSCCGKSTPKLSGVKKTAIKTPSVKNLVGADGMTLIEYMGPSLGKVTYYGAMTGQRYEFSASSRLRYVDDADLQTGVMRKPGFLELREHGAQMFRKSKKDTAPVPPPPSDAVAVNEGKVEVSKENPTQDSLTVVGSIDTREQKPPVQIAILLTGNVKDVKAALQSYELTGAERVALLEAEKAGQNRKSVLALIDNKNV